MCFQSYVCFSTAQSHLGQLTRQALWDLIQQNATLVEALTDEDKQVSVWCLRGEGQLCGVLLCFLARHASISITTLHA